MGKAKQWLCWLFFAGHDYEVSILSTHGYFIR